jgi:hypothetical protein
LGWAVCDTDPFKLHWTWTLWVSGLAASEYWETCRDHFRSAFAEGRLEFPDLVLFADLDPETLRRQKAADTARTRGRHDLHMRISPALKSAGISPWLRSSPLESSSSCQRPDWSRDTCNCGDGQNIQGAALYDRLMTELDDQA